MNINAGNIDIKNDLNLRVWSGIKELSVLSLGAACILKIVMTNNAIKNEFTQYWFSVSIILSIIVFSLGAFYKPSDKIRPEPFITIIVILLNAILWFPVSHLANCPSCSYEYIFFPVFIFTTGSAYILAPLCYQGYLSVFLGLIPVGVFARLIHLSESVPLFIFLGIIPLWIVRKRNQEILGTIFNFRTLNIKSENLREKYNNLRKLSSITGTSLWKWNLQDNKVFLSNQWIRIFGWPQDFNGNKENIWESIVHPDDYKEIYRFWASLESGEKEFSSISHRLKTADGYKWVELYGIISARDANNKPTEIYGAHYDIHERKEKEIGSGRLIRLSLALMKARSIISFTEGEKDMMENICDLLGNETGFEMVWIGKVVSIQMDVPDNTKIVPVASFGISKKNLAKCLENKNTSFRAECSSSLLCALTGRTHYKKPDNAIIKKSLYEDPESVSVVSIPVKLNGGKDDFYVFTLQNKNNNIIGALEIRMLEELCQDLSFALMSIRTRQRAGKFQQELEDERKLFASGPVAAIKWIPFPETEVMYISPNISQFGYNSEDLIEGKIEISSIIHPTDKDYFWSEIKNNYSKCNNKGFELTVRILRPDNEERFVRLYNKIINPDKNLPGDKYLYGYILDISDLISMENYLRESEKRYNILVENSNDAIVVIEEGNIIYVNSAGTRITGFSGEEIRGSKMVYWIEKKNRIQVLRELKKIIRGLWSAPIINIFIKSKNGPLPVEISTTRYIDNNRISYIAFLRDVTARKKIENDLKAKVDELEQFNQVAVSREIRMIELKRQINLLIGKKRPYKIAE